MSNFIGISGEISREPENDATSSGTARCKFSILDKGRPYTNRDGDTKEPKRYHNVVAFGDLAESIGTTLAKGMRVFVKGELSYWHSDTKDAWLAEVKADEIEFTGVVAPQSRATHEPGPTRSDRQESPVHGDDVPPPEEDDVPF